MKKFGKILAIAMALAVLVAAFAACNGYNAVKSTEDVVAVTVSGKVMDLDGKNLVDYLNKLQSDGKFSYSADNGYVTTVNGKTADYQKDRTFWAMYTPDKEMGNEAWGTYEFEGQTYYSAIVGINDYPLAEGTVILFVFSHLK